MTTAWMKEKYRAKAARKSNVGVRVGEARVYGKLTLSDLTRKFAPVGTVRRLKGSEKLEDGEVITFEYSVVMNRAERRAEARKVAKEYR